MIDVKADATVPEPVMHGVYSEAPTPDVFYDYAVKSWTQFFPAMISGQKKADMRDLRDRDYKINDVLLLCEYDFARGAYTGRWATFSITHIISNRTPCAMSSSALDRNHCILSLSLLETSK